MASANGHSAGNSPAPVGIPSCRESEQQPVNPASLVSHTESTPPETSTGGSKKSDSGNSSIQPNKAALPVRVPAVTGKKSVRQRAGYRQISDSNIAGAGAGAGRQNANKTDNGGDGKAAAEGGDQPNAMRAILLEAEIRSARSLNMQLQQQMALLENQIRAQHHFITGLHDKVKALETELKSAKASAVAKANPVSTAAASSVTADTAVDPGSSSLPLSSQAPAVDTCPTASSEEKQPETAALTAPAIAASLTPGDSRPEDACGSTADKGTKAAIEQGGSGMTLAGSDAMAPANESVPQPQPPASEASASDVTSPSTVTEAEVAVLSSPGSTEASSLESSAGDVAQEAEDVNNATDVVAEMGSESDSEQSVVVIDNPLVVTPRMRRHSLKDFWNSSSGSTDADNSPPSSNTRRHRHRAAQQQQLGTSSPPAGRVRDQANSGPAVTRWPLQSRSAYRATAEKHEATPIVIAPPPIPPPSQRSDTAPNTETVAQTGPQVARPLVLRRAMEGREGAEGRSSHLMDCASCQDALPDGDPIGRCDACPRSFCTKCLEAGLRDQKVELERMDPQSRALLDGKQGDFLIAQCPKCLRGKDREFSPPPQGTAPMDHLLGELLRHDLSLCFREPVDIAKHPDYVESIGRTAMMDLGTMSRKLKERRYPRRRGPGQFLEDLNRIWKNCRRYAGCDELGKPHYGNTVPGIVRCALTLEALTLKYCAAHMSDNEGSASWQESTWDFYRQEQERANATARLNQLEGLATNGGKIDTKSPLPDDGAARSVSSCNGDAVCMAGVENSGEVQTGGARESGPASPDSQQQATTTSPATEGRKRSAAAIEGTAGESTQVGRTRKTARILLDVTDDNSGSADGATPKSGNRRMGKKQQQQPPWSPLDRLCDLATTYIQ